ncbi:MAG: aconitase X swivel domain-containing protein [bacterium]
MKHIIQGTPIVAGTAEGKLLASNEPLSFWGGYNQQTGEIIDRRHPLSGQIAAGCVLAIPFTRGSSTTTAVLLEAVRCGKAPAAILTSNTDRFLALASIVADEMYSKSLPVIVLEKTDFAFLQSGQHVIITRFGKITLSIPESMIIN